MEKLKYKKTDKLLRTDKLPGTRVSHASVRQVHSREIYSYVCDEPSCKFYGKPTQQGVCHTTPKEIADERASNYVEKAAKERIAFIKKHAKNPRDYVKRLETELFCEVFNGTYTLQELVMLRGKVAEQAVLLEELGTALADAHTNRPKRR
jgi:hypothetical protein